MVKVAGNSIAFIQGLPTSPLYHLGNFLPKSLS